MRSRFSQCHCRSRQSSQTMRRARSPLVYPGQRALSRNFSKSIQIVFYPADAPHRRSLPCRHAQWPLANGHGSNGRQASDSWCTGRVQFEAVIFVQLSFVCCLCAAVFYTFFTCFCSLPLLPIWLTHYHRPLLLGRRVSLEHVLEPEAVDHRLVLFI